MGENMNKALLTIHNITVGTYDVDFAGHVSNLSYLRWLEDMRLKLFDNFFPLAKFIEKGLVPVIASTKIDYKKTIRLFDKPIGYMWIDSLGAASIKISACILLNSVVTTEASHVAVFIDQNSGKPVKVPQEIISAFINYKPVQGPIIF